MNFRASVPFFKLTFSKSPKTLNANFKLVQKEWQNHIPLHRDLYTHAKKTGISLFDKNRELFESQYQGKSLPSWLENCRCVNQNEVEDLYEAFPSFVQDLTTLSCTNNLALGNQRLKDMAEYIIPWAPIMAVHSIAVDRFYVEKARRKYGKGEEEENRIFLAHKLAWALEMIGRNVYGTDDIVDGSDKRNGLICWHKLPNVGLDAIIDFTSQVTGGLLVLDHYFRAEDYYAELVKFVVEQVHMTLVSGNELIAMEAGHKRSPSGPSRYSSSSFQKLLVAKGILNASVVLNLPIVANMIRHRQDPVLISKACEIGFEVMDSCGIVDDWVDCFGSVEVNERESTDIQTGRQSWLIWKAMDLGSPEQCQRLEEVYGRNDAKCVAEVKEIYRQLNIKEVMNKMAEDRANKVEAKIEQLPQDDFPCSVWLNMLNHYRDLAQGKVARP